MENHIKGFTAEEYIRLAGTVIFTVGNRDLSS
jgi:hypothetical protein